MAGLKRKTKMHPDDAREAARFKELSPHLEIGKGGLLMPTYLSDVVFDLTVVEHQALQLAAELETIDVASDVLQAKVNMTVEQGYELLMFANDLEYSAREILESVKKIRTMTDFVRLSSSGEAKVEPGLLAVPA